MKMRGLSKWWQRWVLDVVLTNPPPLISVVITIFVTVFAVGFWCAHWLDQVDLTYRSFNVFSDNIKGENLLKSLSGVLPVDVVYTWVNGSDPLLLNGLQTLYDSAEDSCTLSHCLPSPYISLMDCSTPTSKLSTISSVIEVAQRMVTHNGQQHNFTVLRLARTEDISKVMQKVMAQPGITSRPTQAYWTSDVGGGWGMKQQRALLVKTTEDLSPSALLQKLFPKLMNATSQCSVLRSGHVHLVECQEEKLVSSVLLSKTHQNEISSNSSLRIHQAILMLQTERKDHFKEVDINRFQDNDELRYSLRSLEKYVPWVRRIFLVTNGQIPHWLNLDHPRLTIVTHQEIFPNSSHLPTYSSPAIESHIHRIPGLSEHYLYLNDDVMLGSDVWPEDFFSPGGGYKVYLSWSLPECSSGCPGSWLGDGYCDESCNSSDCEWDGGDCSTAEPVEGSLFDDDLSTGMEGGLDACATSCLDMWLADSYCDNACNTLVCGFDGGDCGMEVMHRLHQLPVPTTLNATYILPKGISAAWMNLSSLLGSGKRVEGWHTEHSGLRSLSVNTLQEALFIVLKLNVTAALRIELSISHQEQKQHEHLDSTKVSFIIKINSQQVEVNKSTEKTTDTPLTDVKNFTFRQMEPEVRLGTQHEIFFNPEFAYINVNSSNFPGSLASKLNELEDSYKEEELTIDGLKRKKSQLISEFMQSAPEHDLVYHNKSYWPPTIKKSNNYLSVYDGNNMKPENILNGGSDIYNVSQQLGLRTLLWAGFHQQQKSNTTQNKATIAAQKQKNRNIYSSYNTNRVKARLDYGGTLATYPGSLPWEKQRLFPLVDPLKKISREQDLPIVAKRHLLDMFAESLLHVNRLFNSEYGYQARRVPAHMPHFINKAIMERLQRKFKDEFELTSFHKVRQANDMQYAFSYYFFLMSEVRVRTPTEVFEEYDTDSSGTLSDREIRTLLASLGDLPLHYNTVHEFHREVKNCSATHITKVVPTPIYERYADSDLPTLSLDLMLRCDSLRVLLHQLEKVKKYKFSHLSDEAVHFKMVTSNVSIVIQMLDEVRKNRRKFICLNSNLDPASKSNDLIHALVQDAYESLFPLPSSFELPLNFRNRFLYMEELISWRKWRDFVRALIYACLASLVFLTLVNFFSTELEGLRRRWCRRHRRRDGYSAVV